jgi:hypothetical protein
MAREHRILIGDNGAGDSVQADNGIEEGLHDGCGGVWVPHGYEVPVLGEPVDVSQDD